MHMHVYTCIGVGFLKPALVISSKISAVIKTQKVNMNACITRVHWGVALYIYRITVVAEGLLEGCDWVRDSPGLL